MDDPISIPEKFELDAGELVLLDRVGIGHINDTYVGNFRDSGGRETRYIFQRINSNIFPDVDLLMENFQRVSSHLQRALAGEGRRCLELVPTLDGGSYYRDPAGVCWRAFPFVENTVTHEVLNSPDQAKRVGFAFGEFSQILSDLPGPPLHEILPDFHHTPKRHARFVAALASDPVNRAVGAREEIDAALAGSAWATMLTDREVPLRVSHNDSKIENVLFDATTDKVVCVVDLDTTMPGSVLHDFGDLVRTAAATAPEDEADLERVGVSLNVFEALASGFLSACGEILAPIELVLLPAAGKVIVYEQALRFLTDHLIGDTYYKISYDGHNLIRARNQLQLARVLDQMQPSLEKSVSRLVADR